MSNFRDLTDGDDSYRATEEDDWVIGEDGNDTIRGLGGNDTLWGSDGNDLLYGGAGNDRLLGWFGYDRLYGEAGNDYLDGVVMVGGTGDDTYEFDVGVDTVDERPDGGTDTLIVGESYSLYGLNIENLVLRYYGDFEATGNLFANYLTGNSGRNRLDGAAGADSLAGGQGDDTYVVDESGDVVLEDANAGVDTVIAGVSYSLDGRHIEILTLSGSANLDAAGNDLANTLTGNSGNNLLDGGLGSDTMAGGLGDDIYLVDHAGDVVKEARGEGADTILSSVSFGLRGVHAEVLTLTGTQDIDVTGNSLANRLNGNAGHNRLDGGTGYDTLAGGAGNDTYVVNTAGDQVIEVADGGADLVESAISLILAAEVESLTLTGSGNLHGTGNGGNNLITGGAGANRLDGMAGNDTLIGGTGNDTYYIDSLSDRVVELHYEGTDLIYTSVSYSLFGRAVESLIMTGDGDLVVTGNSLANTITGNGGDNQLNGGGGNDTLIGGLGDDTYYVDSLSDRVEELHYEGTDLIYTSVSYSLFGRAIESVIMTGDGDLVVIGNSLANRITGNSGDNHLNGGGGNDTLIGGTGDDSYTVDAAGDIVTEAASEGTDLVLAYTTYTLGAEIENLTMIGSIYWGQSGTGNALNNVLAGNSNHNILDGRAGDDTLVGGDGHDTYYVDSVGDKVVEAYLQGTDEIEASVSYSLHGTHIELLRLAGSEDLTATGNSMGNVLVGNSGNNVLNGKGGSDYLYGGLGSDVFLFESINAHEYIGDFTAAHADIINLNGWTGGVANTGAVTQSGADVLITAGGWNDIRVVDAVVDDVLAHIVW
ncbi:hemolysin-type calcium-binding repeat 2 copies family protein [Asticcacaulis biprosthecium C19]|uniref:Hemolysin-type calcium-binding repeat 2 copies family protein n=1 Tax=Asticcacaulis biprosthecium C19 TaxID=715226 RepID=F4QIZ5_9CAUL|nr:calcium-binding protein [Asticcacaulis biprosthecium]EGF93058.1 hemolysin-type calcium-binding repeat 2 copies family protein [Asticcacaulis biprosthecium C19]